MSSPEESILDNPVWHALSGHQKDVALDYEIAKFYQPDYCPFGAFEQPLDLTRAINEYAKLTRLFFILGERPQFSGPLHLMSELKCLQMIIERVSDATVSEEIIELGETQQEELFYLVNLVQPGYFSRKTALMGRYYGIFKEGKLVSVSGERMKPGNFVEISAVVTHPEHIRKGYALQLVAHTANEIFAQGLIPFLHVAAVNSRANSLYEKLGFRIRRKISFWMIGDHP